MALSLRCECGQVEGAVEPGPAYTRATCYCRDCRAYARWLERPGLMDARGGTDIVAINPRAVRFTAGVDRVACMSLSPGGLLRWYASCCRTPLGNTPRDGRIAYVGLPAASLAPPAAVDAAFGPAGRTLINTGSAQGEVKATPVAFLVDGLRIVAGILGARLRRQRPSLFFDAEGQPIRAPAVLAQAERASLYDRG
ncbi:DUF6151 family protein [Luteimonas saliphila]|uniref:DUF6151 family protein n=1 Tax=Luteimonas saliphila TaxID=2804919 RepID=UPI00192D9E75|nr:DUF6151 family protein [Luteimonas saliphila]